jgi:hypothetical protein
MLSTTKKILLRTVTLTGLCLAACQQSRHKTDADGRIRATLEMTEGAEVDPMHIKMYLDQRFPLGTPMSNVYSFLTQRGIAYSHETYPGAATCVLNYRRDRSSQRAIIIVFHHDVDNRVKSIMVSYHAPAL